MSALYDEATILAQSRQVHVALDPSYCQMTIDGSKELAMSLLTDMLRLEIYVKRGTNASLEDVINSSNTWSESLSQVFPTEDNGL